MFGSMEMLLKIWESACWCDQCLDVSHRDLKLMINEVFPLLPDKRCRVRREQDVLVVCGGVRTLDGPAALFAERGRRRSMGRPRRST